MAYRTVCLIKFFYTKSTWKKEDVNLDKTIKNLAYHNSMRHNLKTKLNYISKIK